MNFRLNNIRIILFFALLTMPFVLDAQRAATLQGRVVDAEGTPLPYAAVAAVSLNPVLGNVTDERGRYLLQLPADSVLRITVRLASYAMKDTVVTLAAGTTVMNFTLKRQSQQLGPVTVTDERSRGNTFTTIRMQQVENNVGPQGGVESLLKTLPDVS